MDNRETDAREARVQHLEELLDKDFDDFLNEIMESDVMQEAADIPAEEPKSYEADIQAEEPQSKQPKKKKTSGWQMEILSYLHDVVYVLAGLILVFLLLFRVVVVSGTSMNNTLLHGDYLLLLSNNFYHDPQYGDIIVAGKESYDNGAPIVKRVIATEGQVVDIDFDLGVVYVGDSMDTLKPLDEPYAMTGTNVQEGVSFPLTVEEGCLFVMGDNRNNSKDSRSPEIGLVDKREVIGKVFFLFLPGTNTEADPRPMDWSRFGWIGGIG